MTGPTLQRLAAFYKACVEDEDRHRLELDPQAFGRAFVSPFEGPESLLSQGDAPAPTAAREAAFIHKATDDPNRPLTYGYPLWTSPETQAVVPLFVVEVAASGPTLRVEGDAVVNYRVLAGHGLGDEDAANLVQELRLEDASVPFRTRLERAIRALGAPAAAMNPETTARFQPPRRAEWHNTSVLFQGGSLYTANLRRELDALVRFSFLSDKAPETALRGLTNPVVHKTVARDRADEVALGHDPRLAEILPLNDGQEIAARAGLDAPLTVVTGPPGTGKSQVVVALLASAVRSGRPVLFASKNRKAVDVVRDRLRDVLGDADLSLRLGARDLMESGEAEIRQRADAALSARLYPPVGSALRSVRARLEALRTAEAARRTAVYGEAAAAAAIPESWRRPAPPAPGDLPPPSALRQESELCRVLHAGEWPGLVLWFKKTLLGARLRLATLARLETAVEPCPEPTRKEIVPEASSFADLQEAFQKLLAYRLWVDARVALLAADRTLDEAASPDPDYPTALFTLKREIAAVERDQTRVESTGRLQKDPAAAKAALNDYFGTVGAFWSLAKAKGYRAASDSLTSAQQRAARVFPVWAVNNLSVRNALPLRAGLFDLVIIDEASQCDLASALPLLYRAKRAVIIGDPYQLRHITTVDGPAEARLARRTGVANDLSRLSYVRRSVYDAAEAALSQVGGHRLFLNEHYRCHPDIAAFPVQAVYKGRDRLVVRTTPEQYSARVPVPLHGLRWHSVQGEARRVRSSWVNQLEIDAVVRLLTEWAASGYLDRDGLSFGIVTPFRPHADVLREQIRRLDLWASRPPPTVGTAHAFQGDERDVMILSPVVSAGLGPGTAQWVSREVNLLNVAVTRARAGLHVVGDDAACRDAGGALAELVACAAG